MIHGAGNGSNRKIQDVQENLLRVIDPEVLEHSEGISRWLYSKEHPLKKHVTLWQRAIRLVVPGGASNRPKLETSLSPLLRLPPRHKRWYASKDKSELYKESQVDGYSKYAKNQHT